MTLDWIKDPCRSQHDLSTSRLGKRQRSGDEYDSRPKASQSLIEAMYKNSDCSEKNLYLVSLIQCHTRYCVFLIRLCLWPPASSEAINQQPAWLRQHQRSAGGNSLLCCKSSFEEQWHMHHLHKQDSLPEGPPKSHFTRGSECPLVATEGSCEFFSQMTRQFGGALIDYRCTLLQVHHIGKWKLGARKETGLHKVMIRNSGPLQMPTWNLKMQKHN